MARQSRVIEDSEPAVEPVTETITYKPGPHDPASVKWGGHTFQANMPKELTGHPQGTEKERLNMELITSARTNPHFEIGTTRKHRAGRAELPKTSDQYRAYFAEWLKDPDLEHVDDLVARFVRDRELQEACEVGTDDYAYMGNLLMPRLHELQKADEMTEAQVAAVWVRHGINQLPW